MFRALSTRRSCRGYEPLADESSSGSGALLEVKLGRAKSLPAKVFGASRKLWTPESNTPAKQAKRVSKIHPLFGLFDPRRRKRATAKPEFARYMEYVKEAGVWDVGSNAPVMYYK